jgi:hypothetical protein
VYGSGGKGTQSDKSWSVLLTGGQARCLAGLGYARAGSDDGTEKSSDGGEDGGGGRLEENEFVALIGQGAMAIRACADEAAGSAVRVRGYEVVTGRQTQARIIEWSSAKFTGEVPSGHLTVIVRNRAEWGNTQVLVRGAKLVL